MPILKIFKGNLADKLYSEKEIIKTKSKGLHAKKAQMNICKRDMEELSLAESLVQLAKNQMFALTEFSEFMDFIHDETNQSNVEAVTLFSSINPVYTNEDKYTNYFAQFDHILNNTDNNEYKDENGEVKSLKEWYPYLYNQACKEYYELYSEISVHQINIYKIANDAVSTIDIRRGEVDLVLSIAKEISTNVTKLIDFATQNFGTDSEKLKDIANTLQEQEQQVRIEYKENIDEDTTIVPVIFNTEVKDLKSGLKDLNLPYGHEVEITITTNITGSFSYNKNDQLFDSKLIKISLATGGATHKFNITNYNNDITQFTINNILTTFIPSDLKRYSVSENYNILTIDGDPVNTSNSNLICNINLDGKVPTKITQIVWDDVKTISQEKFANIPTEQHYYINATYQGLSEPISTEVNKQDIIAYKVIENTKSDMLVNDFYNKRGTYDIYYSLDTGIMTDTPLRISII